MITSFAFISLLTSWLLRASHAIDQDDLRDYSHAQHFHIRSRQVESSSSSLLSLVDQRALAPLWEDITYDTFEDDSFGSFEDGGSDADVRSAPAALSHLGSFSVRIRDNSGTGSSIYQDPPGSDVTDVDDLRLHFWYYTKSMDDGYKFLVEYWSNLDNDWQPLEEYVAGTDFQDKTLSESTILFSDKGIDVTSMTTIRLRFECVAGSNKDQVYLDDILLEGERTVVIDTDEPSATPSSPPSPSPSAHPSSVPSPSPSADPSSPPSPSPSAVPNSVPTKSPNGVPTSEPSSSPASNPSAMPSQTPTSSPSSKPSQESSTVPSDVPSFRPTTVPSAEPSAPPSKALTSNDICPVDRLYPPEKYEILPYADTVAGDGVEDDLGEISSLAFATHGAGRYAYVVSDKSQFSLKVIKFTDDATVTNVLKGQTTTVANYTLNGVSFDNDDWEDISLGPCTDDATSTAYTVDQTCIYIGNFGNNNRGGGYVQRDVLKVFKFPEPYFDDIVPLQNQTVDVATIEYRYGSPFRQDRFIDAEAMFVDWTGVNGAGKGDIYIITKGGCSNGVGRIPISEHKDLAVGETSAQPYETLPLLLDPNSPTEPRPPMQLDITCGDGPFRVWQGADMRRDGQLIALITGASPPRVYFYPRLTDQTVEDVFTYIYDGSSDPSSTTCPFIASTSYGMSNEKKHEAVAFVDAAGTRYADTSECEGGGGCNVPIYFYDLIDPLDPNGSRTPPLVPADQWVVITADDFEGGDHLGSYTVGGEHAFPFDDQTRACGADWSMQVRIHNGVASSFEHTLDQDCSAFSMLRISFDFLLDGFDHMDTLFLELSLDGGQTHYIVADWARDVDGISAQRVCYDAEVVLLASWFGGRTNFGSQVRLRFRTSANALNDKVYIDNIEFQGHA